MRTGRRTAARIGATASSSRNAVLTCCALLASCVADVPVDPDICDEDGGDDPYTSWMPGIHGTTMRLNVAYGGGCSVHEFAACWDHTFTEERGLLLAKVRIGHDGDRDPCAALVERSVDIPLDDVAAGWRDETGLHSGALLVRVTLLNPDTAVPPTEETIEWMLD